MIRDKRGNREITFFHKSETILNDVLVIRQLIVIFILFFESFLVEARVKLIQRSFHSFQPRSPRNYCPDYIEFTEEISSLRCLETRNCYKLLTFQPRVNRGNCEIARRIEFTGESY